MQMFDQICKIFCRKPCDLLQMRAAMQWLGLVLARWKNKKANS